MALRCCRQRWNNPKCVCSFPGYYISLLIDFNSIIGEDKALSIKIGQDANADSVNIILVRGMSSDVDRAVKEILRIVENAENELIDNSHVSIDCHCLGLV